MTLKKTANSTQPTTDEEAFRVYPEHRWLYNKYDLALRLGHYCGVAGEVAEPSFPVVIRPIVGLYGMGEGAHLGTSSYTDEVPNGYFWCELFEGEHLSVDYYEGIPELLVEGFKRTGSDFTKFSRWDVRDMDTWHLPSLPNWLQDIADEIPVMNVEFIGGKIIEVHLRPNPDFSGHRSNYVRVVRNFREDTPEDGETFIKDPCDDRIGFWIKEPK